MTKKSRRPVFISLLVVLQAIFWTLVATNRQSTELHLLSLNTSASLSVWLIVAGLISGLSAAVALALTDKTQVNDAKISEWQAQDIKLVAAVTSDREKQLEAKIATLETALKTALKKH